MSDQYGPVCSNEVAVTDPDAYAELIKKVMWGDEGELDVMIGGSRLKPMPEGTTLVKFVALDSLSPTAVPYGYSMLNADGDEDELDMDEWVKEVRALMPPGEILHVIAGGNEKTWYVEFSELVISADHEKYLTESHDTLLEDREKLLKLIGV